MDAKNASAYRDRAMAFSRNRDDSRAVEDFSRAIELEPTADDYLGRARAFRALNQPDRALRDYDKVLKLNPTQYDNYLERATLLMEAQNFQSALSDLDNAADGNSTVTNGWAFWDSRGRAYAGLKDYSHAVQCLDRAIQLNPAGANSGLADLYRNRGDAKKGSGDIAGADADYEKAHSLQDMDEIAKRADAAYVSQEYATAAPLYQQLTGSGLASAMNRLGYMYREGKGVARDDTQSVAWYRKAAENGDALGMNELGWMYERGRGVAQDDAKRLRGTASLPRRVGQRRWTILAGTIRMGAG
jgi:tetratricopeptide (TPR) repeat protein